MPRQAENVSRQRTKSFTLTINGLLTYCAMRKRDLRECVIDQPTYDADFAAIERVLKGLGYTGDLDTDVREIRGPAVFGANELRLLILGVLRRAESPMTARQIAVQIIEAGNNRGFATTALAVKVAKACGRMPKGAARKGTDGKGNVVWSRAA